MRRAPGVLALFSSVLLGLVLLAAAQPGAGSAPDVSGRLAAAAPVATGSAPAPLVAKRWG
ncbi:MAG TPA: hypothetical protein VIH94_08385 [Candidatus Limnocylindrales bacterium]